MYKIVVRNVMGPCTFRGFRPLELRGILDARSYLSYKVAIEEGGVSREGFGHIFRWCCCHGCLGRGGGTVRSLASRWTVPGNCLLPRLLVVPGC